MSAAIILYNDKEYDVAYELVHNMVKRAIELEGTATGEHGVGLVKRDYLQHELGETTVDAMRRVSPRFRRHYICCSGLLTHLQLKKAFDPLCLLNCDKIVRMQPPKPGEVQEW